MDLVTNLEDKLLFAVPKKGRLAEACAKLLLGADIKFRRSNRLDIALSTNLPVALVFLPAADIPVFVAEGRCSLGITGIDQVMESNVKCSDLLDLQFGQCKLQVQVPEKGDIRDVKQLVGKTVVTSFTHLTTQYFRKIEGKAEGEPLDTNIKFVGGSVEAAVALGVGDAIVDLVESGETMRAAGLYPIDTLLETSARLIASETGSNQALSDLLFKRIQGVIASHRFVLCNYNIPRNKMKDALKITPGRRAATVAPLDDSNWVAVSSMVEKKWIAAVMDDLTSVGAEDILVVGLENCRI